MKLEMRNIDKKFGKVQVLFGVDFEVDTNEFHALVGENGAGKSTLVKILTGIEQPSAGEILIDGEPQTFKNVIDSEKKGIVIVNQEFNLFNDMTILDNLFIAKERTFKGIVKEKEQKAIAKDIFKRLGITLDLNQRVSTLSVGNKQMLEIAKALIQDAELIILDEPTAALSDKEIDKLFTVLERLRKEGKGVVYISHRLQEVFELCETVTVLRDGHKIIKEKVKALTHEDIVENMVGYAMGDLIPKKPDTPIGDKVLEVQGLFKKGYFEPVDFEVHEGEVVGFAGLMGAGRTEIMNTLFGFWKKDGGRIAIAGEETDIDAIPKAKGSGLGYVTENRKEEGLFLDFNVKDNVLFNTFPSVSHNGLVKDKKLEDLTDQYMKRVNLKANDYDQLIKELSGGNQQKVVLGKWLATHPKILILDEPTRGIDVNSKKQIYEIIFKLKEQGIGIIVVSSELVELLGVADTIYVMREGVMTKRLVNKDLKDKDIMKYMMGGTTHAID